VPIHDSTCCALARYLEQRALELEQLDAPLAARLRHFGFLAPRNGSAQRFPPASSRGLRADAITKPAPDTDITARLD
jgi:hypothetical protein